MERNSFLLSLIEPGEFKNMMIEFSEYIAKELCSKLHIEEHDILFGVLNNKKKIGKFQVYSICATVNIYLDESLEALMKFVDNDACKITNMKDNIKFSYAVVGSATKEKLEKGKNYIYISFSVIQE